MLDVIGGSQRRKEGRRSWSKGVWRQRKRERKRCSGGGSEEEQAERGLEEGVGAAEALVAAAPVWVWGCRRSSGHRVLECEGGTMDDPV